MKLKVVACLAFLLNTALFGTYYAVSKEVLGRMDPIVFTFFEMISLVPVALCILVFSRKHITRAIVRRGVLVGSVLCLALFTISIALKYTSATSTAFFPALNGFLAALTAWFFLKQPLKKATWAAGLLSIAGAALLILNSPMGGLRGSLIAFLGGLFFTAYVFLADHEQQQETAHWPLFGVELLTMAGWACLVSLLFGNWQAFHPDLPKDIWVILYVAGACTFVPTLITVLLQKHISPLTVSFIYVLEPIIGAVIANFYLHELLPLYGYIGGGLVTIGAIIQTWGSIERQATQRQPSLARGIDIGVAGGMNMVGDISVVGSMTGASPVMLPFASVIPNIGTIVYPLLFLFGGGFLLVKLGGFPPVSWQEVYALHAQLLTAAMWQQTANQLFIAQAACWLVAWISVALIGGIGILRGLSVPTINHDTQPKTTTETNGTGLIYYALGGDEGQRVNNDTLPPILAPPLPSFGRNELGPYMRENTRITEDLSPTMPEIQLWEEYPEPAFTGASYEISTLPARKREEIERRRRVRRQRLIHADVGA